MIADPREIQRLRFQPGQDLLSRDFRDGAAFEASLREWHNRALHQAHGVASGLCVRQLPEAGRPTDLEVSPGLAYDAKGRALFLPAAALVPVPGPWPGVPHLLVLRSGPAGAAAGGPAVCLGASAAGGDELAWVPEAQWRPGAGAPVARLDDDDGEPLLDDRFRAPAARPLARPRIASGTTVEGATPWQRWFPHDFPGFAGIGGQVRVIGFHGIEVQVSTSAAGFRHTPCYFAWVQGTILARLSPILSKPSPPLQLHLFSHLTAASPTGFRFRAAVPFEASLDLSSAFAIFQPFDILPEARRGLSVCWLGIEMDEVPEPDSQSEVPHGKP